MRKLKHIRSHMQRQVELTKELVEKVLKVETADLPELCQELSRIIVPGR